METHYHPNGNIRSIIYKPDGMWHREDGPCCKKWDEFGDLLEEVWCLHNRIHRFAGPALSVWVRGVLMHEEWFRNGHTHRDDGPAFIERNISSAVVAEQWCQNGLTHRDGGPAVREWNNAGGLILEEWYQNDILYRLDGPAVQRWDDNGALIEEEWWHDYKLTLQEIEKILRPDNIMAALRALPQPIAEEIAAVFRSV